MTEPPNKIDSIFSEAVAIESTTEREAFLAEACGPDRELHEQIKELLAAYSKADQFLERPAIEGNATLEHPITEKPGSQIGPYKLLQKIGEGGMGVVYMAEQTHPVTRRVALKIIKPGMDTQLVIARFEAERQALAIMDHHNIAKVLDAGSTESGRPYFVMELVKGLPITDFCDRSRSTTAERLELFVVVCHALRHAHLKGIIHRDIKPSNVLVTMVDSKPVPKVIDFGVAKAINQQLTARTLFTAYGQMVGTPQYMSPEQADISGLDVDTRSDVYSLGVLLYELLTGSTPLDGQHLRSVGFAKMQQIIRDEEPPKPSTRVSTMGKGLADIAHHRNVDPDRLSKMLRGDLDWIVMMALDKERGRRYESAGAFASDVERYLRQEPIDARPPSAVYRMQKLIRRNKGPFAAAAVLFVSLLLGISGTSIGMLRATLAEADAAREANRARHAEAQAKDRLGDVQRERDTAAKAQDAAEAAQQVAVRNANQAQRMLEQVDAAVRYADGLRLVAESEKLLSKSPGLSLLLAIEGTPRQDRRIDLHNNALMAALRSCRERRTIFDPDAVESALLSRRTVFSAVCTQGNLVAAACVRRAQADWTHVDDDRLGMVWNIETGDCIAQFRVPGVEIRSLEFSPDGRSLLATYEGAAQIEYDDGTTCIYSDHVARLWQASTGRELAVFKGHTNRVTTAHFSSDGDRIVTASWDKTARVWDARSGEPLAVMEGSRYSLESATFSSDGMRVLTVPTGGLSDSRAKPKEPVEGELSIDPPVRVAESVRKKWSISGRFSSGRALSTGNVYAAPRLWDAATGTQLHVMAGRLDPPAINVDVEAGSTSFNIQSGTDVPAGHRAAAPTLIDRVKDKVFPSSNDQPDESLCACFSPDGSRIATGSWQGDVTIWNATDGTIIESWKNAGAQIRSIQYSFDGRLLLLTRERHRSAGDELMVVAANDGKQLAAWQEFPAGIRSAVFDRAGQHVLIVPGNLERQERPSMSRGTNGKLVLDVPQDRTAYVRSVETGHDVAVFRGHESLVTSARFRGDHEQVISASEDGTLRLWNAGELGYETVLPGHSSVVAQVAISPDGRYALTTYGLRQHVDGSRGGERSVRLWDMATGELVHTMRDDAHLENTPARELIRGAVRHAEFDAQSQNVLTVGLDSFVRQLEEDDSQSRGGDADLSGKPVDQLESGVDVSFSPVRMWNVAAGQKTVGLQGLSATVKHAALSPDGMRIVTVSDYNYRYVVLDRENERRESGTRGSDDVGVRVWNAETGELVTALLGKDQQATWAGWSADGRVLVTMAYDSAAKRRSIQMWDAGSLSRLREIVVPRGESPIDQAMLDARGKKLLTWHDYGAQNRVSVWDLEHGAKITTLAGDVYDAALSPDGKWIATAEKDWSVRFWDAANGKPVWLLAGHQGPVRTVAFSPDGRWLASGSEDATTRIWSTVNGSPTFTLTGHQGPVYAVAFSPDSALVLTGSGDGTARIWPLDPLPLARRRQPRELTHNEREQFLSD